MPRRRQRTTSAHATPSSVRPRPTLPQEPGGTTRTIERDHRDGRRSATTGYEPRRYAFRFPNNFVNVVWSGRLPPVFGPRVEWSTDGRCGGMAFASLDFFHLGQPVPPLEPDDFAGSVVPPDGHPLADYLYSRQIRSMIGGLRGLRDGLRFIRWSGRSTETLRDSTLDEIDGLVESIDAGEPVVLGLIKATSRSISSQGDNHQVVCDGYRTAESGELEFLIYEPNDPYDPSAGGYEVVLGRSDDFEQSDFPFRMRRPRGPEDWRGFFVQRYRPRRPGRRVIEAGPTTDRPGGGGGGTGGGGGADPGIPDRERPPHEHLN